MILLDQIESFILESLQIVFDQFGWWGVFGMMAFENATTLTPSEVVLGFAGWMLIAAHSLPLTVIFTGALYAAAGSLVGASAAYWVSRLGGRPVIDKLAKLFRIDPAHISKAEKQFQQWGTGVVFFGRMIPGVRTLISFPAGLAKMPYLTFVLVTFSGAYIWCTLLLGAGFFLGKEWSLLSFYVKQFTPYLLAAGILALLGYWLIKKRPLKKLSSLQIEPAED